MMQDAQTAADDAERERELWRRLRQEACADARQALFGMYAGFARQVAARHFRDRSSGDLDLQELRHQAYAGLLEAIDRFDPDRAVPFRAFAARRVSGSILDGIARTSERREQIAFRNRLRAERVRSLVDVDADAVSSAEALEALARIATDLALGFMLDTGLAASEGTVDRAPNAYDGLAWKETIQQLLAAVDSLPDREQYIVRQHYLNGVGFDQLCAVLAISKGRVSQLHRQAIGRLRKRLAAPTNFVLAR